MPHPRRLLTAFAVTACLIGVAAGQNAPGYEPGVGDILRDQGVAEQIRRAAPGIRLDEADLRKAMLTDEPDGGELTSEFRLSDRGAEIQAPSAESGAFENAPASTGGLFDQNGADLAGRFEWRERFEDQLTPISCFMEPRLDVVEFGRRLQNALKNQTVGYAMQLRRCGKIVWTSGGGWARTPADGERSWAAPFTAVQKSHIASVSKFFMAAVMTRVLAKNDIPIDAPIVNYLPSYWYVGGNVELITFRHLLRHQTRFPIPGKIRFAELRQNIADNMSAPVISDSIDFNRYDNVNYELMRVLMAVAGSCVDKSANFRPIPAAGGRPELPLNDIIWDALTRECYEAYIRRHLLIPADANSASLQRDDAAFAYVWAANATDRGYSEEFEGRAASDGWFMNVTELLNAAGAVRRAGVLAPASFETLSGAGLGFDNDVAGTETPAGPIFHKGGFWWWRGPADAPRSDYKIEQAQLLFLPEDMEFALLVNSDIWKNGRRMSGDRWILDRKEQGNLDLIVNAYKASLR